MILAKYFQKFLPQMQNLGQSDPNNCFFYSSSALNLHLQVFTKLHGSISKNTKFPTSQGGTSPSDTPLCWQMVLMCHQIDPPHVEERSTPPVHSILLVCLDYLPPPQYIYNLATPLHNANVCKGRYQNDYFL